MEIIRENVACCHRNGVCSCDNGSVPINGCNCNEKFIVGLKRATALFDLVLNWGKNLLQTCFDGLVIAVTERRRSSIDHRY